MKERTMMIVMVMMYLVIPFVSSIPPVQTSESAAQAWTIIVPKEDVYKLGNTIKLHFHIYNSSGFQVSPIGAGVQKVNCSAHLYNQTGSHVFEDFIAIDGNDLEFKWELNETELPTVGDYTYLVWCNNTYGAGYISSDFIISEDGASSQVDMLPIVIMFCTFAVITFAGAMILIYKKRDGDF